MQRIWYSYNNRTARDRGLVSFDTLYRKSKFLRTKFKNKATLIAHYKTFLIINYGSLLKTNKLEWHHFELPKGNCNGQYLISLITFKLFILQVKQGRYSKLWG